MPTELVLLVGLPGAGKSTFCRERFAESHVVVSKDAMRKGSNRIKRQRLAIEAALVEGKSVVLDNTSVSREERAVAIEAAKPFGAKVVAYWFDESVAACRERNEGREGAAKVPLVAIYTAAKRFETPTLEEEIDEIYRVRLGTDGFTVERLQ